MSSMAEPWDSWEYLSKCLQMMSCCNQTSRVATFRLHLIRLHLNSAAESTNPPSLSSFLFHFHLWIMSPNPNSRKFTETHRGHVLIDGVCSREGSKKGLFLYFTFFSEGCPEEAVVWEHINRGLEQLKALFQDRDKTPCAYDEPPPNKDLLSQYLWQTVAGVR